MNFLPDLAGWALSGGAGGEDGNNNQEENTDSANEVVQETEEEIRAKRIARLAARFEDKTTSGSSDNGSSAKETVDDGPSPMQVDSPVEMRSGGRGDGDKKPAAVKPITSKSSPTKKKSESTASTSISKKSISSTLESDKVTEPVTKKKRGKEPLTKQDPAHKIQRKKELLLKKILNIRLTGSKVTSSECIEIDIGSTIVTEENIAEILTSRLAIPPSALQSSSPKERNLIAYLGSCHKNAAEELKNTKSESKAGNEQLLQEIKRQVVSYAASSLMEPDLFALGKDGIAHLAKCLSEASMNPASSITIGVSGKKTSFYACLCEELYSQDQTAFETVIKGVVANITESLSKCDTVMDSTNGGGLVLVSALTSVCSSKKAAAVVTKVPNFLLPPAESPKASEKISTPIPPPPAGATQQQQNIYRMMAAMTQGTQGYLGRSGPALEKNTLLGLVMKLGTPMDNPSITSQFQNAAGRSRSDVRKNTDNMRRQLKAYQDVMYSLVKALITAGEEARKPVSSQFIRKSINERKWILV